MQILKFQVGIISLDSQDPRILEMLAKNVASKALPLDDLSGAVSAYYQSSSEPVKDIPLLSILTRNNILKLFSLRSCQHVSIIPEKNCL